MLVILPAIICGSVVVGTLLVLWLLIRFEFVKSGAARLWNRISPLRADLKGVDFLVNLILPYLCSLDWLIDWLIDLACKCAAFAESIDPLIVNPSDWCGSYNPAPFCLHTSAIWWIPTGNERMMVWKTLRFVVVCRLFCLWSLQFERKFQVFKPCLVWWISNSGIFTLWLTAGLGFTHITFPLFLTSPTCV